MGAKRQGAWIPEPDLLTLETLRLGPSDWNTLMVVMHQQYRYGGREARITQEKIAQRTGLWTSTVKRSTRRLIDRGLLRKTRCGVWRVLLTQGVAASPKAGRAETEGVNMVTPSRGQHGDTEPTLLISSRKKSSRAASGGSPFSRKQTTVVEDVFREASRLLGRDALGLAVRPSANDGPGPAASRTFAEWRAAVMASGDKAEAGRFVRAVLALRRDPRVVGQELIL